MLRLLLIVMALGFAARPAQAAAPVCWDYAAGGWDAVGAIPGPEPVRALALTGDGRLLGGFVAGVGILDLDDPAAPQFSGFLPTSAPVTQLAADGDRILALSADGVLWYGLLTAGLPPAWGDSIRVEDTVDHIALEGRTAALVLEQRALLLVDVSDPKHLEFGGFVVPPVAVLDLALDGGLAYLGTQLDRFSVYDVSDPGRVVFVGSAREGLATGSSIAVRFPTVYAAAARSIYTYDVSDPAAPLRTGRSDVIATTISALAVAKDRVYALTRSGQLVMFQDQGPGQLRLLGHAMLPGQGLDLVARDDQVYAAAAGAPGVIHDTREALHPGFDRQDLDWKIETEDFSGNLAYAITSDGLDNRRLEVLEFGGGSPLLARLGTVPTVGVPVALVAREPFVAFSTSLTDLTMIDVSNPAAPRYMAITSTQTVPRGLLLIGDGAYVASNSQGLVGYDISNPGSPWVAAQIMIERTQVAWSQLGDYALIGMTGSLNGMFVVECQRPQTMRVVAWVSLGPVVADVQGAFNHAYIADAEGRVHVYDLTDPVDPRPREVLTVGEGAGRLAAYGRHVYYVDAKQGVVVLDAIEPDVPVVLGRSLVPIEWSGLAARSGGIYLPAGLTLSRLPLPCDALSPVPIVPAPATALTAAPNPFNPRTTLSFTLAADETCRLTIFDLRGRRVATLVDGRVLAAGRQSLVWDGRDEQGQAVASGVYAARLTAGDLTALTRLTLVR